MRKSINIKVILVTFLLALASVDLAAQSKKIVALDYWFDDGLSSRQTVSLSLTSGVVDAKLDAKGLSFGVHTLFYRIKDSDNKYSSTESKLFIKVAEVSSSTNLLEYWFDNESTPRLLPLTTNDANFQIETGDLPFGVHVIHLRMLQGGNKPSSVISRPFVKIGKSGIQEKTAKIKGYRYWFDNDMSKLYTVVLDKDLQSGEVSLKLPVYLKGNHTVHVQFYDNRDYWSGIVQGSFSAGYIVGIDENTGKEDVDVYFQGEELVINKAEKANLKIYSTGGVAVYQKENIADQERLSVSSWNKGIYIITFEFDGKLVKTVKVIK